MLLTFIGLIQNKTGLIKSSSL